MAQEKTRYDRIIDKVKNNKITSLLIVAGTIIISISVFTDALQNIVDFFSNDEKSIMLKFDGTWVSDIMEGDVYEWAQFRDRVDPYSYRYVLELKV